MCSCGGPVVRNAARNRYYDDANVSAKLAEDVIEILQMKDERACENKLLVLLDYERFELIKVLLRNRAKVLYCTRLKQAQNDEERRSIEEEMLEVRGQGLLVDFACMCWPHRSFF